MSQRVNGGARVSERASERTNRRTCEWARARSPRTSTSIVRESISRRACIRSCTGCPKTKDPPSPTGCLGHSSARMSRVIQLITSLKTWWKHSSERIRTWSVSFQACFIFKYLITHMWLSPDINYTILKMVKCIGKTLFSIPNKYYTIKKVRARCSPMFLHSIYQLILLKWWIITSRLRIYINFEVCFLTVSIR